MFSSFSEVSFSTFTCYISFSYLSCISLQHSSNSFFYYNQGSAFSGPDQFGPEINWDGSMGVGPVSVLS